MVDFCFKIIYWGKIMKSLKIFKIIIAIIVILIIIVSIILINLLNQVNREKEIIENENYDIEVKSDILMLENHNDFYTISECIKYYISLMENGDTEAIYNILDDNYKLENKINKNNIKKFMEVYNERQIFNLKEVYYKEKTVSQVDYFAYGTIKDNIQYRETKEANYYIIVSIDYKNSTFAITKIGKEKYQDLINGKYEITTQDNIEKNDYNGIIVANIEQETIAKNILNNYKNKLLNNPEEAYQNLDEDYKKARFDGYNDFIKYITNNIKTINQMSAVAYQTKQQDGYTQYVIMDKEGNYYIFRETAVMNYTVILDQYTIDLPEYIEKYNKSEEKEKVALCINKFIQAINAKDYKYAYSKLSDSFKQNYFTTQESFEKYIKENFFENNKISFNKFGNQATIYTYETVLADKNTEKLKVQNFVVKLGEGTEFEMSFQINENL